MKIRVTFLLEKNIHEHICTGLHITIPFISRSLSVQEVSGKEGRGGQRGGREG